jgi:hypothetical protein
MKREDCQVGMHVYFGRDNGAKTFAVIMKLNRDTAKVRTLEKRGSGRGSAIGSIWNVAYSMMVKAAPVKFSDMPKQAAPNKLVYSQFQPQEDIHVLQAILCVYSNLSPENLSCDGELPAHQVVARRKELTAKLSALQTALGRTVSEEEALEWERQRNKAFGVSETAD